MRRHLVNRQAQATLRQRRRRTGQGSVIGEQRHTQLRRLQGLHQPHKILAPVAGDHCLGARFGNAASVCGKVDLSKGRVQGFAHHLQRWQAFGHRFLEIARKLLPVLTKLEVECDRLEQVKEALATEVDVIMLDNMSVAAMKEAVALVAGRVKLEASGGVRLETIRAIAETGVDYISTSKITQSAPAVDIGLDDAK